MFLGKQNREKNLRKYNNAIEFYMNNGKIFTIRQVMAKSFYNKFKAQIKEFRPVTLTDSELDNAIIQEVESNIFDYND